jgi:hypothetical protein
MHFGSLPCGVAFDHGDSWPTAVLADGQCCRIWAKLSVGVKFCSKKSNLADGQCRNKKNRIYTTDPKRGPVVSSATKIQRILVRFIT